MKILFTHRYYWPDSAPYALMLRSIAQHFATTGNDVMVYSSKVSYRDISNSRDIPSDDEICVSRCWVFNEKGRNPLLRLINVFLYCFGLFFHIVKTRPDVVTASTFPPVFAAWFAGLGAKITGAKFIYHMMDIHPEVSQISGGLLGRAPFYNILRFMDNQSLLRASKVIVLSEDMATTIRARGLKNLPIEVINNFLLESGFDVEPPKELVKNPGTKRIIFAGNMGRFQNLDVLAEGVAKFLDVNPDFEVLFLGDGQIKPDLVDRWAQHKQFQFSAFLPFSQAKVLIREADIGVVSLKAQMYKVAYPSKIFSYWGLGVPVLCLIEPNSEISKYVINNDLGVVAKTNSAVGIKEALEEFSKMRITHETVQEYYEQKLSVKHTLERWECVVFGMVRH